MGMNLVVLTGRLTDNVECKYTQSGKGFARFSLAVNRSYKRDETDFINCVAWEKRAELAAEYLRKGSMCGIQGTLRVRSYDDDNGQKKRITEVLVENIEFLDSKQQQNATESKIQSDNNETNNNLDDEFPF